jgi:glutathione synthase/RimK-type ligase-like ATP-grasp enzyme
VPARATVLIATEIDDLHADAVIRVLHERGAKVFRFHPEDVPTRCLITVTPSPSGIDFTIRNAHHAVSSYDVVAAWFRRPGQVKPAEHSPDVDEYVRLQASDAVRAVYSALEGRWLSSPDAIRVAEDKMTQLRRAAEWGLRVPHTCMSNDPEEVRKFNDRAGGSTVVKPSRVQGAYLDGGFRFPLAARWDGAASDVSIAAAPSIFQEVIEKVIEVRAVVIGDRVFAAEVPATEDIDVRAHDIDETYRRHELPPEVADKLRDLTHGFGVRFASADLVVTPAGEYVFLDLNPNGQWLWLETQAGLPLTDAVVDYFLHSAPG